MPDCSILQPALLVLQSAIVLFIAHKCFRAAQESDRQLRAMMDGARALGVRLEGDLIALPPGATLHARKPDAAGKEA